MNLRWLRDWWRDFRHRHIADTDVRLWGREIDDTYRGGY